MDTSRPPGGNKSTSLGLRLTPAEVQRLDALVERFGNLATRHKIAKLLLLQGLEWMEKEGLQRLLSKASRPTRR
jgi:hypothetical protein